MSNYVERMKEEHKALKQKTDALNAFIHSNETFKTLDDLEQVRMIKQVGFMEAYLATLESRIWVSATHN